MHYSQIKKSLALILALALIWTVVHVQPVLANAANKSAVALLVAKDSAGKMLGTGTGFIVNPDGVLVTNYHVLLDAADIEAVMSNGDRVKVKSLLNVDRAKDFAILQLAEGAYSTLEIGDSDQLKEFDYLSALGFYRKMLVPGSAMAKVTVRGWLYKPSVLFWASIRRLKRISHSSIPPLRSVRDSAGVRSLTSKTAWWVLPQ